MTDNVKHSTSYFHEVLAKAFEMFKNGYEPVMETPFQPRRLGSAFVTEYKPVRESLDEVVDFSDITVLHSEQAEQILDNPPEANEKLKELLTIDSTNPHAQAAVKLRELANDPEKIKQLTIQQKWEAEEALNELAQQSQELGMYEVDKGQVKVYSKSELEAMEWSEFKKLIDAAGIRGRRRANLTRDYLIYQEENLK